MKRNKTLVPFIVFFILLTVLVRNNGFFWDSIVLGSGYAHWYYNTNFQKLFVSEDLAGYPPLFGMYLALGWKLFGKSLLVSHALILPFLIGIVWQARLLVSRFIEQRYHFWVLLLVLIEPTFLAQATQIAPDIILVFLYLWCLNSILSGKRGQLALALIALSMLSPRGTILVVALYLSDIIAGVPGNTGLGNRISPALLVSKSVAYLPAFIITCAWLYLHNLHFGWILYNPESAWGQGSEKVDIAGFIKNLVIIGWRFADFGKAVAFVLLLVGLIYTYRTKKLKPESVKLLVLALTPFIVLSGVLVFYQNPIAHRYYIVVYMLLLLLFGHVLQYTTTLKKGLVYGIVVVSLLAGHFVVALYPDWLSKGWDGTLAHLPYYQLRADMITYLKENDIPVNKVGSSYPNLRSFELTDLSKSTEKFAEKNLTSQTYILHSNIFNDFTDQELTELKEKWQVVKELSEGAVHLRLYRKPTLSR